MKPSPNVAPNTCCGCIGHATSGTCEPTVTSPYVDTLSAAATSKAPDLSPPTQPRDGMGCNVGARDQNRSGVALIMVLGVLAVIVILGVAFAIAMRTESTAASHYVEVARARQLVHAGLARALEDLQSDLGPDGYNSVSYPMGWGTTIGNNGNLDFYVGEVRELIPEGIYRAVGKLGSPGSGGGPADDGNNDVGGGETESVGGGYRLVDPVVPLWREIGDGDGRVAYLILNLSGLLDANVVSADGAKRGVGADLAEIVLQGLEDEGELLSMADLETDRSPPFESIYEMSLSTAFPEDGITNFGTYSRCPAWSGNYTDGFAVSNLVDQNMLPAFEAMAAEYYPNPPDQQNAALALWYNLYDYQDTNSTPGSALGGTTEGPWVEAVPMISEVMVTNRFIVAGNQVRGIVLTFFEYAYPFAHNPTDGPFSIEYTVSFTPGTDTPSGFLPATPITGSKTLINPTTLKPYDKTSPVPAMLPSQLNPTNFEYEVHVYATVRDQNNAVVDTIPTNTFTVAVSGLEPATSPMGITVGADVIDPVWNWHAYHWQESSPFPYSPTMGEVNNDTLKFYGKNAPLTDEPGYLAVKNAPIETVGELGSIYWPGARWNNPMLYMLYTSPTIDGEMKMQMLPWLWRSVRLYDHGDGLWDRALDYLSPLTATSYGTNNMKVFKGAFNPNSEVRDALASVFYDMPIQDYPGGPTNDVMDDWGGGSEMDPRVLADAIRSVTATNPLRYTSDLGRQDVFNAMAAALPSSMGPAKTEVQKELIFRNAGSLLNTRQNLYAILVAGQTAANPSYYGLPDGMPRGDQRALALVWRDPEPDSSGRHPCFIRWFTWLEK